MRLQASPMSTPADWEDAPNASAMVHVYNPLPQGEPQQHKHLMHDMRYLFDIFLLRMMDVDLRRSKNAACSVQFS